MLPFNFHHLYYFYVIAQEGVMSLAAKKLHVSQPALSSQLKQLENHLGVPLFTREGKNLLLTEEGRSAMNYAQTIFNVGQELSDLIRDKSKAGSIRIQMGVSKLASRSCASELCTFLFESNPHLYTCLKEDKLDVLIRQLKDHNLDLIFSETPFYGRPEEQIHNFTVAKIPVVFCGHRSLLKKYKRSENILNHAPMLLPFNSSPNFYALYEYFEKQKINPHVVGEFEDQELILRLAQRGEVIAPLNRFVISKAGAPNLAILPYTTDIFDCFYLITKTRKKPHPLVEKAIKHFKVEI